MFKDLIFFTFSNIHFIAMNLCLPDLADVRRGKASVGECMGQTQPLHAIRQPGLPEPTLHQPGCKTPDISILWLNLGP